MKIDTKDLEKIFSYQDKLPVAIGGLVRSFGLEAYRVDDMEDGISGAIVKENNKYIIYTNANEPIVRRRFTIAHELAHYLLHKNFIDNDLNGNLTDAKSGVMYRSKLSNTNEREANQLASEILMPIQYLNKNILPINLLAEKLQVSREAIKIRLNKLENKFLIKDTIN